MEDKYWPYINYVGHMESLYDDAKRLLKKIRAWDQYGASGWGANGREEFFGDQSAVRHATNATGRLKSYLSDSLIVRLDRFYAGDYLNPIMNISKIDLSHRRSLRHTILL